MAKKRSEILSEEMELLRSEIKVIEENDASTDDDIERAEALLEEWDSKKALLDKALNRESKVDEVFRAALDTKPVSGDGASVSRSAEFMKRTDPYDSNEELHRSLQGRSSFNSEDVISRAKAAVEQAPRYVSDAAREQLTALVELDNVHAPLIARHMLLTGSPQYHEEFTQYVKSRGYIIGEAMRTAMSLTDANGGYLVPFTLDPTIILTNAGIAGPIRSISTVKTIATDNWNGVTSAGVSAAWTAEATETADATPTFANKVITPKKADAWVFGSYEVLADSGFASELGRLLADAKVRLEEEAFATANTGATKPVGVISAVAAVTTSLVGAAATNAFAIGDVYSVSDNLRPRDAAQASWLANKKIYSKIRQFDTSGGGGFWANLGMGVPNQLLGQPAYEASTMESAVTTGGLVLLAGNFAEYYIVDRVGMSVLYDPLIRSTGNNRPTGQAGWYAFWRTGADVVDPAAFRLLQLNTVTADVPLA